MHDPWMGPLTVSQFDAWVLRSDDPAFASFLACRAEDGGYVGFVNVSHIIRGSLQSAFLGYGGLAPHSGRGYMTEALALVVEACFTHLGLHRLEANIQPGNERSLALARRCGFRREGFSPRYLRINGEWRDHERWAILSDDWQGRERS